MGHRLLGRHSSRSNRRASAHLPGSPGRRPTRHHEGAGRRRVVHRVQPPACGTNVDTGPHHEVPLARSSGSDRRRERRCAVGDDHRSVREKRPGSDQHAGPCSAHRYPQSLLRRGARASKREGRLTALHRRQRPCRSRTSRHRPPSADWSANRELTGRRSCRSGRILGRVVRDTRRASGGTTAGQAKRPCC